MDFDFGAGGRVYPGEELDNGLSVHAVERVSHTDTAGHSDFSLEVRYPDAVRRYLELSIVRGRDGSYLDIRGTGLRPVN
jgi:tRNA splicing endonuclease